jgi:glycogen phosphorylase
LNAGKTLHEKLSVLSRNLWWTWQPEVVDIFRDLEPKRWRELAHNPVALLEEISPDEVERRAEELVLVSRINYAYRRLGEYMTTIHHWGTTHTGPLQVRPVAYFSAEFGLHESLPVYSGGLGVLSGDHLKSASDLGVPLVGVGLFYTQGYFLQRLDGDGWQQEDYIDIDTDRLPIERVLDRSGMPVLVQVETRSGIIRAHVWRVQVGRTMLLLLDSNVEGNSPEDRNLTARLYGGDVRTRIRQELMLGVGGLRALVALGIEPGSIHLNEGHSAFAPLESVRRHMATEGLSFHAALREVTAHTVFTTHTPVEAGHDRFDARLVEEHLGPLRDQLGLSEHEFMGLGRVRPESSDESFCMTVLALKTSSRRNAVSGLHGRVSRRMWQGLWPGRSEDEVPIGHITNGVHMLSWLAPQMRQLYDRHLPPDWPNRTARPDVWKGIDQVDDGELWETHMALKARMLDFVRRRVARQCRRREESEEVVREISKILDLDILTIGFARRFATYKRADLLFSDLEHIDRLMHDSRRPIQIVYAGEAHPRDDAGKKLIQKIAQSARASRFRGRIAFIEDYDINVGRHLVQGVDLWLNNPRRPLEASGTSGQKAVLNGGLNLSILDGWWAEAYDGTNGFAIGTGLSHVDVATQDSRDAADLFRVLETTVIPLYYDRDEDGLPRGWIERMKRAISSLGWRFNADRMVMDYVREGYLPAAGGLSCDMRR